MNKGNNCFTNRHAIDHSNSSLKIEWMSTDEAAEYLRIPVKSLRNQTSNGKIPHHKLFRLNRYRKDELEKLLLSQRRGVS